MNGIKKIKGLGDIIKTLPSKTIFKKRRDGLISIIQRLGLTDGIYILTGKDTATIALKKKTSSKQVIQTF
ncbi:MAG: hypothetical protein V4663_04185 [Bacteroidota bacterium]